MDKCKALPREVELLRRVSHPNIINVFDFFEAESHCFLVLELAENGNLLDFINDRHIPEVEARFLYNQMCEAINFCHSQDIVHRDIKCENLLLDGLMNLKVAGMAVVQHET